MSIEDTTPAPTPRRRLNRWTLVHFASLFVICFALFHLLGFRADVGFLSGTLEATGTFGALLRGVLYTLAYFLAVIASPILLLTALIDAAAMRLANRAQRLP